MIDFEKLYENINIETVAEAVGIPMKHTGSTTQIICPGHLSHSGHRDSNFGSCVLTSKGYYCFAAQESVGVVQMVMEQKELNGEEITYGQAIKIIAETCGGLSQYIIPDTGAYKENKPIPLLESDLDLLNLNKFCKRGLNFQGIAKTADENSAIFYEYVPVLDKKKNIAVQRIKPIALERDSQPYFGLRQLYNSNPEQFWELITANLEKGINETEEMLNYMKKEPQVMDLINVNHDIDIKAMKQRMKLYADKLQNLKKKIEMIRRERNE